MDSQPTIDCKFPIIHTPNITGSSTSRSGRPFLRRTSVSDPHLDIPHFLSVGDQGFGFSTNIFNTTPSAFNLKSSSENMDSLNVKGDSDSKALNRKTSALELCSSSSISPAEPLRKVASVANHDLMHTRKDSANHSGGFLSNAIHHFTGTSQTTLPQSEDQGLTMNARPSTKFLIGGASTPIAESTTPIETELKTTDTTPQTGTLNKVASGMLGVLNRGFFAKQVMCNQEERYRYMMALDR